MEGGLESDGVGWIRSRCDGAAAEYVDVATHFKFEFISDDYEFFGLALLLGVFLSFAGLIGWARHLDRPARVKAAGAVFAFPWVAVLLGYPINGINVHGAAPIVLMLVLPATILSVVLLFDDQTSPDVDHYERLVFTSSEIMAFPKFRLSEY